MNSIKLLFKEVCQNLMLPDETLLFMDEIQNKGIIEVGCKRRTFALANSKFEIDNYPDRKPTDQNPGY